MGEIIPCKNEKKMSGIFNQKLFSWQILMSVDKFEK